LAALGEDTTPEPGDALAVGPRVQALVKTIRKKIKTSPAAIALRSQYHFLRSYRTSSTTICGIESRRDDIRIVKRLDAGIVVVVVAADSEEPGMFAMLSSW